MTVSGRGEAGGALAAPQPFTVTLPEAGGAARFSGSLSELAQALRAGRLLPGEVPLLEITRALLARVEDHRAASGQLELELLPPMAAVIALKARLLLPRPALAAADTEDDLGPDDGFDVLESVEALAELDLLVEFLSRRRREREGLIPARGLDLGLPRRPRTPAGTSLSKLVAAARNAVREVSVPLLARERLSLQDALTALRAFAGRLRRFWFHSLPTTDWGERSTYFTALLEGVKGGELEAQQEGPYAPIEVKRVGEEG